jgi:hypothetical protein
MMTRISPVELDHLFKTLHGLCGAPAPDRSAEICTAVRRFGYLPWSYQRALAELNPAETLCGLEEKLSLNGVFNHGEFTWQYLSPARRAGFQDARWLQREQHQIKLTNLLALGKEPVENGASFSDWLKYILVLPAGNPQAGILGTTLYFLPFQERDLGSAYIPRSSAVHPRLADQALQKALGLDAAAQVQCFMALCQLAGHPIMYDVLPQTGRFSRMVLARPELARWFDLKALDQVLRVAIHQLTTDWQPLIPTSAATALARCELDRLDGIQRSHSTEARPWQAPFQACLLEIKRQFSSEMLTAKAQPALQQRVRQIVAEIEGWEEIHLSATEAEITRQDAISAALMTHGLWTAPGGAWCSAGAPVYDGMSHAKAYPVFRHFDANGREVSDQANLDCLTPFYLAEWETGELNQPVVDFFLDYLSEWQQRFNFDAFRFDHVDHVVDAVSVDHQGRPASYRIPAQVLAEANRRLKAAVPHFGALAEYMLWDRLYRQYHQEMGFDVLWGDDQIRQAFKGPPELVHEHRELSAYHHTAPTKLSILKTYNNQDGEFGLINQYPGQLTPQGALYKLFMLKFMPGGAQAQRPMLFIDGDESFTPHGFAATISAEIRLHRSDNEIFFERFDALGRFAAQHPALHSGRVELLLWEGSQRPVIWLARAPQDSLITSLLMVANSQYPTWIAPVDGAFVQKIGQSLYAQRFGLPQGLQVMAEYGYDPQSSAYIPKTLDAPTAELFFDILHPAEFHFFQVTAA